MSSESGETCKRITWWLNELTKMDEVLGGRSYHDGEHYNSVRRQNDIGLGPAKPIIIEVMIQHEVDVAFERVCVRCEALL